MKLYCFVILVVFISGIFTVGGGEWGTRGMIGVNSLPLLPSTNQTEDISHSSAHLVKRIDPVEHQSKSNTSNQEENDVESKQPPYPTSHKDDNNKGKDDETEQNNKNSGNQTQPEQLIHPDQAEENEDTAKQVKEEAMIIRKVIIVLGSLGASLLLVAIAIAVLYWKVRRQQKLVKIVKSSSFTLPKGGEDLDISNMSGNNVNDNDNEYDNSRIDNNNNNNNNNYSYNNNNNNNHHNNNNNNEGGNGSGKRDNGGGVGNGEASMNDAFASEKSSMGHNSNSTNVMDNEVGGVSFRVVGNNEMNHETSDSVQYHHPPVQLSSIRQLTPPVQPSAPPAEKVGDTDSDIQIDNVTFSTPILTAPPAYSPTAPPIYALPHIPIPEFDGSVRDMILYMDGNNNYQLAQQQNLQNSDSRNINHNNNGTFISLHSSVSLPPLNTGVWYAAGPTSQTNTPIDVTPHQQSNHPIIIPSIHSPSNLNPQNSTSNLHSFSDSIENNENNSPTHQRHDPSII